MLSTICRITKNIISKRLKKINFLADESLALESRLNR